ncbi:hypothetical protein [Endozoicomonas elysicola]|uniref:Uncharacterized protein n=1 Tax=Endozoicomonas elysicola TaxID=305900 RepID=A0A081K5N1_9GAMM|nr:hypothetical protein [Endozoicomonas elysicola]KEI69457.1 hypothetical protein GV64_00750 [Endozoicomonas elysicola]
MKIQGNDHNISSLNESVQEFSDGSKLKEKTFSGMSVSENDQVDKQVSLESDKDQKRLFFKDRHDRRVSTESNDSGYQSESVESGNNIKKDDLSDHGSVKISQKMIKTGISVKDRIKLFENWSKNENNSARNKCTQSVKKFAVSVSGLIDKFEDVDSSPEVDEETSALDPFEIIVTGAVSKLVITSALDVTIGKEYERLKKNGSEEDLRKVYKCFEQALEERLRYDPDNQIQFGRKVNLTATVFDALWMMLSHKSIRFTEDQAFDVFLGFNGVDLINGLEAICSEKPGFDRRFTI